MKTLYLLDGFAHFFRAYHAIRTPMTSPVTKEPTNATFGFVGMLLKLLREAKPDYLAVAIDVGGDRGTFRSEVYPEYKANRDEPPEGFKPQVERCLSLLETLNVPVIGAEGFEADDVIATLAQQLGIGEDEILVRIISKDKDLEQCLAHGRVEMLDIYNDDLITESSVMEAKGITPAQVIDVQALTGDSTDNVPGVPGVGIKTASALINEFGSLDAVLAEVLADKPKKDWAIKGKRRENIAASVELLPISKELVTLRTDTPVAFDLESANVDRLEIAALEPLMRELGFNRYRDEVLALAGDDAAKDEPQESGGFVGGLFEQVPEAHEIDGDYEAVTTKTALKELVKKLKSCEIFAIDTETTSTQPMRAQLCGISVSWETGMGRYIPVRAPEGEKHLDADTVLDALRPVLEDPSRPKCGHNLKYDLLVLRRAGVELRGIAFDSMIASYVIDASRSSHGMNHLALALLNRACIPISDLIGTGKKQRTFDTVPLGHATPYACEDADVSLQLYERMHPELRAMKLDGLFSDIEMPLLDALAELEWNGVLVDPDELDRQKDRLSARIEELRGEIDEHAPHPFNPDSPKQLQAALFNKETHEPPGLGIKPIKKTKTGYSTDSEVLEKLSEDPGVESPIPGLILEYRMLTKLVGTYLEALKEAIHPETARIHASFNQTVAATGRLSSSDPNLQNIPIRTEIGREVRRAFVAPAGRTLVTADYSQIELRLLAHLSRDPALIEAFQRGEDIHRAVAAEVHGIQAEDVTSAQRSGAKMVNFGIVYGITAFGLARRLGVSQTEAGEIIDAYKKRFAGITTFLEECVAFAKRYGYVETILKRRRPINEIESRQPQRRSLAERMAINSVVQGSAADLIKVAMLDLHKRLSPHGSGNPEIARVRMLLQVHDELVFECDESDGERVRDLVVERMESAMTLDVPIVADASISRDWFGGK
ncbi:MAG: DNA polymerase I [Planctomycetota bacterium]